LPKEQHKTVRLIYGSILRNEMLRSNISCRPTGIPYIGYMVKKITDVNLSISELISF